VNRVGPDHGVESEVRYDLPDPFGDWTDELRPAIHQVARDIETQIDAIAKGTAAVIGGGIDEYQAETINSLLGEVEAIVRVNLHLFVKIILEETLPVPQELTFVSELVTVRVKQGLSMESILQAYRIGHRVSWEAVLRMAARQEESERIAQAMVRPSMNFIDVLVITIASTYLRASQSSEADREADARTVVEAILSGEKPEPVFPGSQAWMRRLSEGPGFLVVRGQVGDTIGNAQPIRRIAATIGQLGVSRGRSAVIIPFEQGLIGFLEIDTEGVDPVCEHLISVHASIEAEAGRQVFLGVGLRCQEVGDAPRGLREAEEALEMTRPDRPVIALSQTPVFLHLMGQTHPTIESVVAERMKELTAVDRRLAGELSRTVLAYAKANQNARVAAESLHCHVNTVKNRVRKIKELTGLDPNNFENLVDLVTAQEILSQSNN